MRPSVRGDPCTDRKVADKRTAERYLGVHHGNFYLEFLLHEPCLCTLPVLLPLVFQPVLEEPSKIQMIKRFNYQSPSRTEFWCSSFLVHNIKLYIPCSQFTTLDANEAHIQESLGTRCNETAGIRRISVYLVHFPLLCIHSGIPLQCERIWDRNGHSEQTDIKPLNVYALCTVSYLFRFTGHTHCRQD